RTVQFVRRPVGATSWQVLGSATTGQDGTTTFPVASVTAPTQYAAYYADSAASPARSHPATAVVHVLGVLPTPPNKVANNARVTAVQVTPKPAVSSDGFRFPLLNAAFATPPGTWSLDQGVDLFAAGHACGDAAKEVAVGDGTVIQTGIAGFGPTAPVIRMSSGP